MSWLLALHSSSEVLGVGVRRLGDPEPGRTAAFPLGRGLSNELFTCVEQLLPAAQWPELGRLVVATGPGGFTGTRLTVVLARTLAQQLGIPLHGVSSFLLVAAREPLASPVWVVQELPRRGRVAGLYGPDPLALAGVRELEPPRLFAPGADGPSGFQLSAQAVIPRDVDTLLAIGAAAERQQLAGPWQPVLPLYPTSPVGAG
jgi:tRNA threonylcarbamoyl adenosine modification protein YeaZ